MITKVNLELDAVNLAVVQQALLLASINLQATMATVQAQIVKQLEDRNPNALKSGEK